MARVRLLALLREADVGGREMTWPESGEATTTVPGVTAGGGTGESALKSGWMFEESMVGVTGRLLCGLPKNAGVATVRSGVGGSSGSMAGSDMGKCPLRAFAGDTGRLPGIGSSRVPLNGVSALVGDVVDCITVSRVCSSTVDVSQDSKPSFCALVRPDRSDWKLADSRRDDEPRPIKFVREVMGRTACWSEARTELQTELLGLLE